MNTMEKKLYINSTAADQTWANESMFRTLINLKEHNITLVSDNEYCQEQANDICIIFLKCEHKNIFDILNQCKDETLIEIVAQLQYKIFKGIFILIGRNEVVIGCPFLDQSLSWSFIDFKIIVSDSSKCIADLCDLPLSKKHIALHLISSLPYYPFQNISLWENVMKIDPFSVLRISKPQVVYQERIWKTPTANKDVAKIQKQVRERLSEQVRDANSSFQNISADISGGVDSATLGYMLRAHRTNAKLFHSESAATSNSDTLWATMITNNMKMCLVKLPSINVSSRRFELELSYNENKMIDSPLLWADTEGYVENIIKEQDMYEGFAHFIGIGGDELFTLMPSYAHTIVRQNGVRGKIFKWKYSLLTRQPIFESYLDLSSETGFVESVIKELEHSFLDKKRIKSEQDWIGEIQVPSWLSDEVKDTSFHLAKEIVNQSQCLDSNRARHQTLESLLFQRKVCSQLNRLYGSNKVEWKAPFLDKELVEGAIAIPTHKHMKEGVTKPMLYEAVKGIVPIEVFTRKHKGDYSLALYEGYKEAVRKYINALDDFITVKLGIVDPEKLLVDLSMPAANPNRIFDFARLIAVERWLRHVV